MHGEAISTVEIVTSTVGKNVRRQELGYCVQFPSRPLVQASVARRAIGSHGRRPCGKHVDWLKVHVCGSCTVCSLR